MKNMTAENIFERNNINIIDNDGPTLIFAHGFGTDQTVWHNQVRHFRDHYRIVLFDHVGSGKSDKNAYSPHRYSTLHGYADDLLEICAALRLHNAIYIGHSVSSMIGLLAAVREPSCFEKLVFIGASPRYLNDGDYVGGFEQTELDALYTAMTANYYAWVSGFAPLAMGNPERPGLAEDFARSLSALRPDISQSVARAIFQSDHRADLPRLQAPVLLLQANEDIVVPPEVGVYMNEHIPDSTLITLSARGHLPHVSEPEQVTRAIISFI